MVSRRKRIPEMDDHCHQPIRAKGKRHKVAHGVPPGLRKQFLPTTAEIEANINKIINDGMVFYDYDAFIKPLDQKLELKVWETIVRRSREYPELVFMMADLDLLNARKLPRSDPNSLLNIEFKHNQTRQKIIEGLFLKSEPLKSRERKVETDLDKMIRFKIFVKPALNNKNGFHGHRLFDAEGTTLRHQSRKHYSHEKVLKLCYVKDLGVRWTACVFIPFRLQNEDLILRRSTIGGQKLWIPVRPSSSGLSKWTELIVPKMVNNTPVWASAEGIVGYLRPVKILGVQVWLPTSSKGRDLEEVTRKPKRQKSKSDEHAARHKKIVTLAVPLKTGKVITGKRPRLVVLDFSKEEERKRRERYICRKALETIARKLVEKEDSIYPQIDLESSSSESEMDTERTPKVSHNEKEDNEIEEHPRASRDRIGEFFGIWKDEGPGETNYRQESVEGRVITSFFLPNQEVPVITAIAQPSWKEDEECSARNP